MPATRNMKEFKVKTTTGEVVTIRRRCFGSGVSAQKQMDTLVYDEASKKFKAAPKAK